MAEEIASTGHALRRVWIRWTFVAVATGLGLFTCVMTAYLIVPEYVLSRGLEVETYSDATALTLGLKHNAEIRQKYKPNGGTWQAPTALDRTVRHVLVATPALHAEGYPSELHSWAIVDTEQEKVVGSLRVAHPTHRVLGTDTITVGEAPIPRSRDTSLLEWTIGCTAQLPSWWPRRARWGENGAIVGSESIGFDLVSHQWRSGVSVGGERIPIYSEKWFQSLAESNLRHANRSLVLPDGRDEIVTEHRIDGVKLVAPQFTRMTRRAREIGHVRWEDQEETLSPLGGPESLCQLLLPPCPLDESVDWCVLVQEGAEPGAMLNPAIWRLDLDTGQLTSVSIPIESTPDKPLVASNGQTIIFRDDGFLRQRSAGLGSSRKVVQKSTKDLMSWHPDEGMKTLFKVSQMARLEHASLPKGRVLVWETGGPDDNVKIHIVPLDGSLPRQIYP